MLRSIRKTLSRKLSLFFRELKLRWNSQTVSLGLQRDLQFPFEAPDAKIPLSVRPLKATDVEPLMGHGQLKKDDYKRYNYQMRTLDTFAPHFYVAENIQNEPCYMQLMVGAKQNDKIQQYYGDLFPRLSAEEALIEAAYMNPQYRGLGIMPAAMARIAEKAKKVGARWVITFVNKDDIPCLKGCMRAGFTPYILRIDRWFLFRLTTHFEPLNDMIMDEYEHNVGIPNQPKETAPASRHNGVLVNGTM